MTPRTGRPKSDNPKRNSTRIRMTDEEVEKLNYCCQQTDVIGLGIQMVYEKVQK